MTTKERLAELRKHVEIWERLIASDATEVLNELESLLRENEDLKALCFKAGCSHVRPEYLKNLERVAEVAEKFVNEARIVDEANKDSFRELMKSLQALRGLTK